MSEIEIKYEGPRLYVVQLRNELRRESFEDLSKQPPFWTTVRRFRDEPVCIAIAKETREDGCMMFLLRGFIPGGKAIQEAGFVKHSDGSWTEIDEEETVSLREKILASAPREIGP